MIITSPYIRCVQTAVAVSEVLPSKKGTQVPLLIDTEVSEALSWILITCSGYWIALLCTRQVGIYKKPSGITDPGPLGIVGAA